MAHRIQVTLLLSKACPPDISRQTVGRYSFRPGDSTTQSTNNLVVEFIDDFIDRTGSGGSHPEEEAQIIAHVLSLLLNVRVRKIGFQIDEIIVPSIVDEQRRAQAFPEAEGVLKFDGIEHLSTVDGLADHLLLQFVRACKAYSIALSIIQDDIALAFMLFVVAIECLSSQEDVIPTSEIPSGHSRKRFLRFIEEFSGDVGVDNDIANQLLRGVYDELRSAFAHGGKEAPSAAALADAVGRPYIKHQTESNKDRRTPGVRWFARVVRSSLIGFLRRHGGSAARELGIARIAANRTVVRLRPKQAAERGDVIEVSDDEFDLL